MTTSEHARQRRLQGYREDLPAGVTKVIMKFDLPTGTKIVFSYDYKYIEHCHILEQEDSEMMRRYDVAGQSGD